MTVKHLFPAVEPSLNLDFANSKKLDPRITFTRSSTGTYVDSNGLIKTAAANEARFDHDGATGSSLGLLVEESRTNYIVKSTPITSDLLTLSGVTFSTSAVATPANTTDAILHQCGANANTTEYFSSYSSIPSTGKIVTSVFVKNISATKIRLNGDPSNQGYYGGINSLIDFTVSPPTITKSTANGSDPLLEAGLIALPNGWYRAYQVIDLDITSITSPTGQTRACVPVFINGISGQQFLSWGYQIEAGSFPTSYIPTSGSTVTRSADVANITGTNLSSWYTPNENTVFWEASTTDTSTNTKPIYVLIDSTKSSTINSTVTGSRAAYYVGNTNYIQIVARTPQNTRRTYPSDSNYNPVGQTNKVAHAYSGSADVGAAINGADPSYTTSASLNPGTVDTMWIGRNDNLTPDIYLNGHIARFTHYPYRLTDAQLQALTL